MYTPLQKVNIIKILKKFSKLLICRSFLMSLKYYYRKFQPRRLKLDQDMAINQLSVSHDKGTGIDNKCTGQCIISKFGVHKIEN